MITFNVGPSKISERTKEDIRKAIDRGVLEISHRSEQFSKISAEAINGLRKFFQIPQDYKIFYANSATEAMQLSLGNACKKTSFHFVCGNFSELFGKISMKLGKEVFYDEVSPGKQNDFLSAEIPLQTDFITITQNETSTGVACAVEDIKAVKKKCAEKILAVDITSSAGVEKFEIKEADIWLFSTQKGFGLPAGLALIFVSPKAYKKSLGLESTGNNFAGYFSFENMWSKMNEKFQTLQTPNVLGIYLLAEKLKRWNSGGGVERKIIERNEKWNLLKEFFDSKKDLKFFPKDEKVISKTIFCLESDSEKIKKYHEVLKKHAIVSGKGYGSFKEQTFRIANFPAITKENVLEYIKVADGIFE